MEPRTGRKGFKWKAAVAERRRGLPKTVGLRRDRLTVVFYVRETMRHASAGFAASPVLAKRPGVPVQRADWPRGGLRSTAECEPRVALAGSQNHDRRADPDTIVRSMTSSLVMRMQPDEMARPMYSG